MKKVILIIMILLSLPLTASVGIIYQFKKQSQINSRFSGGTATARLVFDRPVQNGTSAPVATMGTANYRYQVFGFKASLTGNYTIRSTQSYDGFMILYQNNFDPTSPLTNALIANNDDISTTTSKINSFSLTAGIQYYLVLTSNFAGFTGTYSVTFTPDTVGEVEINSSVHMRGGTFITAASINIAGHPAPNSSSIKVYSDSTCTTKASSNGTEAPARFQGIGSVLAMAPNSELTYYSQTTDRNLVPGPCLPYTNICRGTFAPQSPTGLALGSGTAQSEILSPTITWDVYSGVSVCGFNTFQMSFSKVAGQSDIREWYSIAGTSSAGEAATFMSGTNYYVNLKIADNVPLFSAPISAGPFQIIHPNVVEYSVTTSTGSPSYTNRPSAGNPPAGTTSGTWYYHAQGFTVNTSGTYTILSGEQSFDGFLVLYQNTFSSAAPLVNALYALDDAPVNWSSTRSTTFSRALTAGVQYYLVTTSWHNGQFGTTRTQIFGPGTITLN